MSSVVPTAGVSYLYSFPFWIVIQQNDPPEAIEFEAEDVRCRVYPPFRSGAPNFLPMPSIKATEVPFLPGTRPVITDATRLITPAAIPVFRGRGEKPGMKLLWGDEWGESAGTHPM